MDPNATLDLARQAIYETDLTAARDHLRDLMNWIDIGGFTPEGFYEVLDEYNRLEIDIAEAVSAFVDGDPLY